MTASIHVSDDPVAPSATISISSSLDGEATRTYVDALRISGQRWTEADKLQPLRPQSNARATYSATSSRVKRHELPEPEVIQRRPPPRTPATGPRIAPDIRVAPESDTPPPRLRIVDGKVVHVEDIVGVLPEHDAHLGNAGPAKARRALATSSGTPHIDAPAQVKSAPRAIRPPQPDASPHAETALPRGGMARGLAFTAGMMASQLILSFIDRYIKNWLDEKEIDKDMARLWPAIQQQLAGFEPQVKALASTPETAEIYLVLDLTIIRGRTFTPGSEGSESVAMVERLAATGVSATNVYVESRDVMLENPVEGAFNHRTHSTFSVPIWNRAQEENDLRKQAIERQERILTERMQFLAAQAKQTAAPQGSSPPPTRPPPSKSLLPEPPSTSNFGLPGAPEPGLDQQAWADYARNHGEHLLSDGTRMRDTGVPDSQRQQFKLRVQVWRGQMQKMIRDFGLYQARESLKLTLFRFDERMHALGASLGIDGWKE